MSHLKPKDINLFVNKLYKQVKQTATGKMKFNHVDMAQKKTNQNIILYVGAVYGHMIDAIRKYEKETKEKYRIGLIYHSKQKLDEFTQSQLDKIDIILSCDLNNDDAIQETLLPYKDEIVTLTCRPESSIPHLSNIIPHLPYIETPTVESLAWSTDKIQMRKRLHVCNKRLNPKFTVINDDSKKSIRQIIESVGFPLIVKPSGLAASRLVSICFHQEELEVVLKKVFKKIDAVHKQTNGTWTPRILIEQFMEGNMYSVDAYVDRKGRMKFCPMVYIKTGREIGFDDFFGYEQRTPTILNKQNNDNAQEIAKQAIKAIGLKNTSVHVELIREESGWKIIEMGPRVGGFRHMMYEQSNGINHTMNDVLNRIGKKPIIPKKRRGYAVAMKFFAKKEGRLSKLTGIKKLQELKSFKRLYTNKKIGDMCRFAKHGGGSVFNIIMCNPDRSKLLADIRRLEQMVVIEVE
ncbi:MAG: ATP-grasp domain-containing protein [Candidatus Magasanikbacteria bacterium]|jgi:biotin carboxylase|nr:ATP-grasp domain-containing protein [Candidatus Magasanikbacteria bacterium]MBT4071923.1 ATP-grasp domain-containing protein [Candidatus Magasanikbacteria bacterium]